jgi:hypothetical protein
MSGPHSTTVRGVGYYRMSTTKQQASIPEQRDWARRAAQTQDVELAAEFQDDSIAGSEIERQPGLAQMLAWCATRLPQNHPHLAGGADAPGGDRPSW